MLDIAADVSVGSVGRHCFRRRAPQRRSTQADKGQLLARIPLRTCTTFVLDMLSCGRAGHTEAAKLVKERQAW